MKMPFGSGNDGPAKISSRPRGRPFSTTRAVVGATLAVAIVASSVSAAAQDDTTTTTTVTTESSTTVPPTTAASSTTAAPSSTQATSTTTAADGASTTSTTSNSAERARAAANLNLAKAADVEIAQELNKINQAANATLDKIDEANARIEEADAVLARTTEELRQSDDRQQDIEFDLRLKAVEGFKTRSLGQVNPILTDMDVTRALRQHSLLAQASLSTADLLEELRGLLEERRVANAEAEQAKGEAENAQQVLEDELDRLQEQQASQLELKAEAERRIDIWAGELTAYAREDAAIQQVIAESSSKAEVTTAVNNPTTPSAAGFQWPLNARVTSEFGYRIHPVYGTRRLHAGMDIAAPSGTPISSAGSGVVIFAGWRGGYGNTVIVDHGGGITTLYAHQSRLGVSVGQLVDRGDNVGSVGATGTATGNHLHFEVRVNGSPTNPRNYLP